VSHGGGKGHGRPPLWQKIPLFLTKPMKKFSYRFILRKLSASNVAIDAMIRIEKMWTDD
jgi:hypothetical protein